MELTSKPVNKTEDKASDNTAAETTASINKDTEMDVSALLKASKEEPAPVIEKTPLQLMAERKAETGGGIVVSKEELEKANEEKHLKQNKDIDDAMTESEDYLNEADKLIEASKNIKFTKPINNAIELAQAMDAVSKYAETGEVPEDAPVALMTEEETKVRDGRIDSIVSGNGDPGSSSASNKDGEELAPAKTPEEIAADEEKAKRITILIDKTGLGADFHFTPEEQEKIVSATQIKVTEVEDIDLSTITVTKSDKSFIDSVDEYQLSSSKVPVVFPASRFRASMTGLSYGELGDLSLGTENVTFDQLHKKLSIIYNKMTNVSCGKFSGFEDFLKKFAYLDIDLAVYGLVVASFPEISEIQLSCNDKKCGKSYNHKFSPRALLRFEDCGSKLLEAMEETIDCDVKKTKALVESSPVQKHKRIKLPLSKYIVEIGVASAYEYLYDIVQNVAGGKFKEKFPDDVNGILELNAALLSCIRKVYVPKSDGSSYVEFDEFEDVIRALYNIKPEEFSILVKYIQAYTDAYATAFELTDITCPHCGVKTDKLPLKIDQLIFLRYQTLMSTELELESVTVL